MGRRKKQDGDLSITIKNLLRGTADPYLQISGLRPLLSRKYLPALCKWFSTFGNRASAFQAGRRPRTIAHLRSEDRLLNPIPPDDELTWAGAWIDSHGDLLHEFVTAREEANKLFMSLDYESCLRYLDSMEARFGFSHWIIDTRLSLLQCGRGLEAQKTFLATVRAEVKSLIVEFITYYVSERNEETTNPVRFKKSLARSLPAHAPDKEFHNYVLFRLIDFWDDDPKFAADVLRWEFTSSIVDYYETFVRLATHCIVSDNPQAKRFVEVLEELVLKHHDVRLRKLLFLATGQPRYLEEIPIQDVRIIDKWAEGDLSGLIHLDRETGCAGDIGALSAVCQASVETYAPVYSGEGSLLNKISDLVRKVISKKSGADEAYLDLIRLSDNFASFGFAASLALYADTQMQSAPTPRDSVGIKAWISTSDIGPGLLRFLPVRLRSQVSQRLVLFLLSSTSLAAEQMRADIKPNEGLAEKIWPVVVNEASVEAAFRRHEFDKAASQATSAARLATPSFQRVFWRFAINSLLEQGEVAGAVRVIVDRYLNDSAMLRMLPISSCFKRLDVDIMAPMAGDLALPIMLDLLNRHFEDHLTELQYGYEDFLRAHGLKRPSELIRLRHRFPEDQLIYFLKSVCIPSVMQVSIEFKSSRELEDERVAVCSLLKEIDDATASAYEAEIREITRKQSVSQGLRDVERSKIWIDQDGLRRWATKTLEEDFTRYRALCATGLKSGPLSPEDTPRKVDDSEPQFQAGMPLLPKDEISSLLANMVSRFLYRCYFDRQNGLDCYLSLRIRHGALSGQMRAPLEDEKIITLQREAGSEDYAPNQYWIDRLSPLDRQMALSMDVRLRSFSREFDALVENFSKHYVQIQSDYKKLGLFSAGFVREKLELVANDIHGGTTFASFLDLCFQIFWESVDISLEDVRNHIEDVLAPRLNRLFVGLLSDVDNLTDGHSTPDLDNAIRNARTHASHALDQVKDWFRQPKPLPPRVITLRHLIEISLHAVTKMHQNFDPKITYRFGSLPPYFQLQKFTDIFIILLDNVWRHAGNRTSPKIVISAEQFSTHLEIEFRNEIAPGVRNAESEKRVSNIHIKIEQGGYHRAVISEGGTGLMKIRNIVGTGPSDALMVDFGFKGRDSFFVRLKLPGGVIVPTMEGKQ